MPVSYHDALQAISTRVRETLLDPGLQPAIAPEQLLEAALAYPGAGGKALRPALLTWSCTALGGDAAMAIRAGAAIELYHTFTLVHDDIIDRDPLRRGQPSVHARMTRVGCEQFGLDEAEAAHYGLSMALLAGDVLQCWAVDLLGSLDELGVAPQITLRLIRRLQGLVGPAIIEGEARDIQLPYTPVPQVGQDDILRVILTKTSTLFAYCGWAGGLLAQGQEDEQVRLLAAFAERAGIAFQLQDDVLGLTADEATLGKPVGSDLREGKRTLIIALAWERATPDERTQLQAVLGNHHATPAELDAATALLRRLGVIDDVQAMATSYLSEALDRLTLLPRTEATDLLNELAVRMVKREK